MGRACVSDCRVEAARHSNGHVVPVISDNVHEIRGYNRGIDMARGQYVVLLQVCLCSDWQNVSLDA